MVTWNWRGSSRIALAESSVVDEPVGGIGRRADHRGDARASARAAREFAETAEKPPDDEGADREERDQLDHRFHRDREDQPVLVLRRIEPPRAERHGEGREQQRHRERERRDGAPGVSRPCSKDSTTISIVWVIALSCSAI